MIVRLLAAALASALLFLGTACDEEDWDDCCECVCTGTACDDEEVFTIHPEEEKCKAACADHCAKYSCGVKSYDPC